MDNKTAQDKEKRHSNSCKAHDAGDNGGNRIVLIAEPVNRVGDKYAKGGGKTQPRQLGNFGFRQMRHFFAPSWMSCTPQATPRHFRKS